MLDLLHLDHLPCADGRLARVADTHSAQTILRGDRWLGPVAEGGDDGVDEPGIGSAVAAICWRGLPFSALLARISRLSKTAIPWQSRSAALGDESGFSSRRE